jgi:hypothetical protein
MCVGFQVINIKIQKSDWKIYCNYKLSAPPHGQISHHMSKKFRVFNLKFPLWPTQPPNHWVPGALSLGVKRPGREADHSPPSSAEVKECLELYFRSPSSPSWLGAELKHRDNFTFPLM